MITNENRKTRNRIVAIVTCLLVMLLCAACGSSDEPTANGTMDHFSDDETLSDEEFQEKYFSKAVDAAEFGGIEFSPLMAS